MIKMDEPVYFETLKEKRKRKGEKRNWDEKRMNYEKIFFALDDSTDGVRDLTIISIFDFL